MAITPPSDLVLDVLKAADPGELAVARQKLQAAGASSEAARLEAAGQGFSTKVASLDDAIGLDSGHAVRFGHKQQDTPETYRKFEAMVLQNFVKSMLPTDAEGVFGKGTAGDIWKGMMAEQIGSVIAESGGIGIAEQLARQAAYGHESHAERVGHANNVASTIIGKQQMMALDELLPGTGEGNAT